MQILERGDSFLGAKESLGGRKPSVADFKLVVYLQKWQRIHDKLDPNGPVLLSNPTGSAYMKRIKSLPPTCRIVSPEYQVDAKWSG